MFLHPVLEPFQWTVEAGTRKMSTAGMIDSGETVITSARGSSSTIYQPHPTATREP
jgi:hypothetical protein